MGIADTGTEAWVAGVKSMGTHSQGLSWVASR